VFGIRNCMVTSGVRGFLRSAQISFANDWNMGVYFLKVQSED